MPRYLFVTGKLAGPALQEVLSTLAPKVGFEYEIAVLNISVAALMTPDWVARRLSLPTGISHIYVPGACSGNWQLLADTVHIPVTPGPADIQDLPEFFGESKVSNYGAYDIAILAEINHAPRLTADQLLAEALRFRAQGADLIDLGCEPGSTWNGLADAVKLLRDQGCSVSIDTFNVAEATAGAVAGAELILSVNAANRHASVDWGCEVVAIPDQASDLASLDATVEFLADKKVPHRLDPILEPIGFGFGASLQRYFLTRQKYPQHEMLMGIGNLSELTETDSAPVNLLLLALCQELGIRSVLTTAVANWAYSTVQECDLGRRLAHYAIHQRALPKKVDDRLILLRDRKLREQGPQILDQLAAAIKDRNYRIFAEGGLIHVMNGSLYLKGENPFELFAAMSQADEKMDSDHAFYLGFEMAKALTALTLRKNYTQDQALHWGFLTRPESSHRQNTAAQGGARASG
jgi:dihydropteroate synthase-like protein